MGHLHIPRHLLGASSHLLLLAEIFRPPFLKWNTSNLCGPALPCPLFAQPSHHPGQGCWCLFVAPPAVLLALLKPWTSASRATFLPLLTPSSQYPQCSSYFISHQSSRALPHPHCHPCLAVPYGLGILLDLGSSAHLSSPAQSATLTMLPHRRSFAWAWTLCSDSLPTSLPLPKPMPPPRPAPWSPLKLHQWVFNL